nr:helix-turn-helix domain-containing protein [Sporosarcina sp. resist]
MNVKKKKSGNRGKFVEWLTPEGLIKIEGWARDGLTNEQIAQNIGITRKTLQEWIKRYGDISDTLKRGKEVIDRQVENALLKRALGYQYNEVTQEKTWSDELGIYEMSVTKIVTKEVNPDTTAQIFWLKNRKPKEWRDKQDIEHSGSMDINNPLKDLSTEDLRKLIDK